MNWSYCSLALSNWIDPSPYRLRSSGHHRECAQTKKDLIGWAHAQNDPWIIACCLNQCWPVLPIKPRETNSNHIFMHVYNFHDINDQGWKTRWVDSTLTSKSPQSLSDRSLHLTLVTVMVMNDLLPPLLFNVNQPSLSKIKLFQNLTMKIQGSRSWPRSH